MKQYAIRAVRSAEHGLKVFICAGTGGTGRTIAGVTCADNPIGFNRCLPYLFDYAGVRASLTRNLAQYPVGRCTSARLAEEERRMFATCCNCEGEESE